MSSLAQYTVSRRSIRDLTPNHHYSIRIQQFSLLAKSLEKYECSTFEIGGYKWRLRLYPKGNSKSFEFVNEHRVSLYLAIQETDSLPKPWEVFVEIKFFAFDHIHNNYAMFQDGSVRRYHEQKTECGIENIIRDRSVYLVDDTCVLGAEVFVLTPSTIHESIYCVNMPSNGTLEWKIPISSTMKCNRSYSEEFIAGNHKWELRLDPEDCGQDKKLLFFCLQLIDCKNLGTKDRVFANYELRVRNKYYNKNYKVSKLFTLNEILNIAKPRTDACYFYESSCNGDTLTVEVEILFISVNKLVS